MRLIVELEVITHNKYGRTHEDREDRATREHRLAGSGECRDGWHHEGNFARDGDANPASQQLQRIDAGRSRSGEAVVRHRPRLHHPAVSETRTARRHHRAFHHASAFGPYRWPAGPVAQRLGRDTLGFANLADGRVRSEGDGRDDGKPDQGFLGGYTHPRGCRKEGGAVGRYQYEERIANAAKGADHLVHEVAIIEPELLKSYPSYRD